MYPQYNITTCNTGNNYPTPLKSRGIRWTDVQNINTTHMTKRSADTPSFPDTTGWTPREGSTRHQVTNPSNKNVGQFFWRIQTGDKLTYFEYEDSKLRVTAKRDYWASKSKTPTTPQPPPSPQPQREDVSHGIELLKLQLDNAVKLMIEIKSNQTEMMKWLRSAGYADSHDAEDMNADDVQKLNDLYSCDQ